MLELALAPDKPDAPFKYNSLWMEIDEFKDLLCVVEEVRTSGKLYPSLNSTFIIVILKLDHPSFVVDVQPIPLCNYIDKIIEKIIAIGIKPYLSNFINPKKIGF
jgi:hypothetical protein